MPLNALHDEAPAPGPRWRRLLYWALIALVAGITLAMLVLMLSGL